MADRAPGSHLTTALPGVTPVKKFKDRKTCIRRIRARIHRLGEPTAPKATTLASTPDAKADQPTKPKAERKAKGDARAAKGAPAKVQGNQ